MKRFIAIIVIISITVLIFISSTCINAEGFDNAEALRIYRNRKKFSDITAPSYVVFDYDYEQLIASKDCNSKRPVASLVKLMTVYIAYEYVSLGKLSLSELITASSNAAKIPGATAFIGAGDKFTLESALYAIIISSCNDVTVALAEHISGSESDFVALMNLHAAGLGMANTKFIDCTGINNEGYTTAYDMALLSYAIIKKHPEFMNISKIQRDINTFKNGTGEFHLYCTNKFLKFVPGSEGLKIGMTSDSTYCISATYKDDTGRRLIVVLLGASDENVLYAETRRAFEYCFANYSHVDIQEDGEFVKDIKVTKGVDKTVGCEIRGEFSRIMPPADKDKIKKETEVPESLEAPLSEGDVIGKVKYLLDGEVIYELDIVLCKDVERAGWFQIFIRWLLEWFGFE